MLLHCLVVVLCLSAVAMAAEPDTFAFAIPWNDTSQNITNVSSLNPAPLLEQHRIAAKDSHFVDATGPRVRFVGTNFAGSACSPDPTDAAQIAAHLHRMGFNCVRLHHMDATCGSPASSASTGAIQATAASIRKSLALLDELIWQFQQNGIYVDINLHVSWGVTSHDWPARLSETSEPWARRLSISSRR